MQVHTLSIEDFSEEEYSLIGIHTTLEDYKFAYLLNKNLQTQFQKTEKEFAFKERKNKNYFSIYNYANLTYGSDWFLIGNSFKKENKTKPNELLLTTETKTYLIPEKKNVDFFIKITGELDFSFVVNTIDRIKNIEQVITAYSIDTKTLKSKDFLIF
jgi:hypothetical protein